MTNNGWGTTQAERMQIALQPDYAPIDGRSEAELMAFISELGVFFNFFNTKSEISGDWSNFFDVDIAFLLARMCSGNLGRLESEVRRAIFALEQDQSYTGDFIQLIYSYASWVNQSYCDIQTLDQTYLRSDVIPLGQNLSSAITIELAPCVAILKSNQAWNAIWSQLDAPNPLDSIWNTGAENIPGSTSWRDLILVLNTFSNSRAMLQGLAQTYLDSDLNRQDHPAHSTLIFAFIRAYQTYQIDLNSFTQRHLDFYYQTVLQLLSQPAQPDYVYVSAALAKTCQDFVLKEGSLMNAGQDSSGTSIYFSSIGDTQLSQAQIAQLSTIFVDRDPLTAKARNIYAAPVANSANGLGAPLNGASWPAFGQAAPALAIQTGICISSSGLLLSEGERVITCLFQVANTDFSQMLETYLQAARACYETAPDDNTLLADGFLVSLSTQKGWMSVNGFTLAQAADPTQLQLSITLGVDQDAIVSNAALIPGFTSSLPMLKIVINPDARCYPYSYFEALQISEIGLQVQVTGLQNLSIANNNNKLDPTKSFTPFGPVPAVGNYFQVQHPELAEKSVASITLNLEWLNLPDAAGGFATYYQGYNLPGMSNTAFVADAEYQVSATWKTLHGPGAPAGTATGFYLFAEDASQVLNTSSSFTFTLPQQQDLTAPEVGGIRLTLAAPSYMFGQSVFTTVFSEAAISNIRNMWLPKVLRKPVVMPNTPYVPLASKITLNYQSTISVTPDKVIHLNAFGYKTNSSFGFGLYPVQAADGQLFLGFSNTQGNTQISLLFAFQELAGSLSVGRDGAQALLRNMLTWSCLEGSAWKRLGHEQVDTDTCDLLQSGLVRLTLPVQSGQPSTELPGSYLWVSAAAKIPQYYSPCINIETQVIKAVRVLDGSIPQFPLPAKTIKQLAQAVPQISGLTQTYPSQSGTEAESAENYNARVAERLRHKQRASQARDYEQLTLEYFPEIWQAKCIGANIANRYQNPCNFLQGEVLLTVIPPQNSASLSQARLLEIGQFLLKLSSPFVKRLHLRHVEKECLKVYAKISLRPNNDAGQTSQQLNAMLCSYLSCWKNFPDIHVNVGCDMMQVAQIAAFIKAHSMVAQLLQIEVSQHIQNNGSGAVIWLDQNGTAYPSTPWSALDSASQHDIQIVDTSSPGLPLSVIGNMTVDQDFRIRHTAQSSNSGTETP